MGPDGGQAVLACPIRRRKSCRGCRSRSRSASSIAATGFARFRERLDEYQYASKQVNVEYIDMDRKPTQAHQFKVQTPGTVVIEYEGRTERVTSDGEQDLTNGLIKVVQGKQQKVYFVQGHGEHAPDASDRTGYSTIASALRTTTSRRTRSCWRSRNGARRRLGADRRGTEDRFLPR